MWSIAGAKVCDAWRGQCGANWVARISFIETPHVLRFIPKWSWLWENAIRNMRSLRTVCVPSNEGRRRRCLEWQQMKLNQLNQVVHFPIFCIVSTKTPGPQTNQKRVSPKGSLLIDIPGRSRACCSNCCWRGEKSRDLKVVKKTYQSWILSQRYQSKSKDLWCSMFFFPECVAKGSRLTLGVWG